ncbi:MAG: VOC family protein [Myxococcales bacterium]|nr:VOC family protein [Myxococcales bacterium]
MALPLDRVIHVNVNCSDLRRSLAFYQDFVGVKSESHTDPEPQDGTGFGMPGAVQWDANILHDERGYEGPGIDLLEWKIPTPTGLPYAEPNHLGFYRLCLLVPDIDAVYSQAQERGVPCLSAPQEVLLDRDAGISVRALFCHDPDGSLVEFVEHESARVPRLAHVNVNCSDLSLSTEWYERVMGLEVRGASKPGPVSGEAFGLAGEVEWDARFLFIPGREDMAIDLLEWKRPTPIGRPYEEANHLGIYRMAFGVGDIQACHDELRAQGVECPPPVFLDMGPEIPVDGVWASFFFDPDGTCLELIETPTLG